MVQLHFLSQIFRGYPQPIHLEQNLNSECHIDSRLTDALNKNSTFTRCRNHPVVTAVLKGGGVANIIRLITPTHPSGNGMPLSPLCDQRVQDEYTPLLLI